MISTEPLGAPDPPTPPLPDPDATPNPKPLPGMLTGMLPEPVGVPTTLVPVTVILPDAAPLPPAPPSPAADAIPNPFTVPPCAPFPPSPPEPPAPVMKQFSTPSQGLGVTVDEPPVVPVPPNPPSKPRRLERSSPEPPVEEPPVEEPEPRREVSDPRSRPEPLEPPSADVRDPRSRPPVLLPVLLPLPNADVSDPRSSPLPPPSADVSAPRSRPEPPVLDPDDPLPVRDESKLLISGVDAPAADPVEPPVLPRRDRMELRSGVLAPVTAEPLPVVAAPPVPRDDASELRSTPPVLEEAEDPNELELTTPPTGLVLLADPMMIVPLKGLNLVEQVNAMSPP